MADETKDATTAAGFRRRGGVTPVPLEPSAWECSVPADATVPRVTVTALTAGDAERAYREVLGVVTFGHPVSVTPADVREKTDAE